MPSLDPIFFIFSFEVGTTVAGDTDSSGVVANCPPSALMRQIGWLRMGGFLAHRSLLRSEDETEIPAAGRTGDMTGTCTSQARANVVCDLPRSSAVPQSRRARRRNSGVDQDRAWLANSSRRTKERAVGMDHLERPRSICMLAIDRTYASLDRDLTGNLWTGAPWE